MEEVGPCLEQRPRSRAGTPKRQRPRRWPRFDAWLRRAPCDSQGVVGIEAGCA